MQKLASRSILSAILGGVIAASCLAGQIVTPAERAYVRFFNRTTNEFYALGYELATAPIGKLPTNKRDRSLAVSAITLKNAKRFQRIADKAKSVTAPARFARLHKALVNLTQATAKGEFDSAAAIATMDKTKIKTVHAKSQKDLAQLAKDLKAEVAKLGDLAKFKG